MRTFAAIISALAVINLMALLVAGGWLWQSDRLSQERLGKVREVFIETLTDEGDRLAREQKDLAAAEAAAEAEEVANRLPMTAEDQLAYMQFNNEQVQLNIERNREHAEALKRSLEAEMSSLKRERAAFEKDQQAFADMRERIRSTKESDQFEKTLSIYQSLEPARIKSLWSTLIAEGEMDQVVTYLDAMQSRKSAAVIEEIEKEDPTLAAELLERLRTHGFAVASSEEQQ